MDIDHWKHVLFEWIKSSQILDIFGFLEHVQLDDYFQQFYRKIHQISNDNVNLIDIADFLKEFYPDYEILYDEANNISSQDYVYIFSLFLHYSCVKEKNEHFQTACTKLQHIHQQSIASFLGYVVEQSIFTKEILRIGIKQATIQLSPLQSKYLELISPMRTPRKSDISPPTPNKDFVHAKLNELKLIKMQLENEKFEKNMLEIELKQSQEKVENLITKCKGLNHEVQELKSLSSAENNSENVSPNKAQRESQFRRRLQKEMQHKDDVITDLKYDIDNLNAINKKHQEKINSLEKQMKEMANNIRELDAVINELNYDMSIKDQKIYYLEEEKKELLEFINETRSTTHGKDISSDCLDFSCSTSLYTTSCSDFGESLAKSVVDVQLKEKENEIHSLNEQLSAANKIKKEMEAKIENFTKIIKDFETQLSDEKVSKTNLFVEKCKEIQLLQNQLNSTEENNLKKIKELNEEKAKCEEELAALKSKVKDTEESGSKQLLEVQADLSKKLLAKENEIAKLQSTLLRNEAAYSSRLQVSEDKLSMKIKEFDQLNSKFLALLDEQTREKIFNDTICKDNETLIAKLKLSRDETEKQKRQNEEDRKTMMEYKKQLHVDMQSKLDECKAQMYKKYTDEMGKMEQKLTNMENENNNLKKQAEEKEDLLNNLNLLIAKIRDENSAFKSDIGKRDKTIDGLQKEVEFINSKLRFLEKTDHQNPKILVTGSDEKFDNMFLGELKDGREDIFSLCSASEFQKRNSQYPPHMRDSYVIHATDKNLTEEDMKFGLPNNKTLTPDPPTHEDGQRRKHRTIYQRPGPPTPSKNPRLSVNPAPNVLKDTTNVENIEKKSTPMRKIYRSVTSVFSKQKDELYGKNIRAITPKRLRSENDSKWTVEKDTTDSDENGMKCSRKIRELDRKEQREKARDMNRPNLHDDGSSTTICSSDTDWIEEECSENERHSNTSKQLDKSLEYIKTREVFRKRQQKMRRRSFTKNRTSIARSHKIPLSRLSSDDFERYKSCQSLRSDSVMNLNVLTHTPKKSYTRNFIDTHFAEVERISDYYVQKKQAMAKDGHKKPDNFWNFDFKDVRKPFPLIVIIMLTICLTANLIHFNEKLHN